MEKLFGVFSEQPRQRNYDGLKKNILNCEAYPWISLLHTQGSPGHCCFIQIKSQNNTFFFIFLTFNKSFPTGVLWDSGARGGAHLRLR